ncbi:efflux RND transporter permease subunit [Aliikangiella coralliicola]|uniref:MMPL family transporter n=1 Tax=Aliikangiella coralliicola TaxID=2592383 RepID=A0A545UI90_9GAMM|nr:efflux RND transporter permease subunit [Aliikangiella coralliicola]TQV89179.1 MMPL family transporter [Aliikangiella coralliicola]
MNPILNRLFLWVIDSPKVVIFMVLLSVITIASGMAKLQISNDFRVYFSEDNPQLKAYEAFEDNYVKSDTATLVVTAKDGDIFTRDGLALIDALTRASWFIDYSYRVSSPTNYLYTQSLGDDIETNYLVEDVASLSDENILEIRRIALNEKRLVNSLITADGKVGIVVINISLPEDIADASAQITTQIEALRDSYREKYPGFEIDNGGSTTFNTTLSRAIAHDISVLLPISYLIIFSGLFLFLRSLFGAITIFILISTCLISTFGFFGWVSPVLTPIAGFAPSILLSIMVADSVHILVTYYHQLHEGQTKREAILKSLHINFMPVLITSITTIIGFLSLNFSESPPYRDLGNMVSLGVLIALIFSLVLLPALLMVFPVGKNLKQPQGSLIKSFANFVILRKKRLLILTSSITLLLIIFIPNNRLSDNWATYFDESFELIQLVKRLDGYLSGINGLEYSLKPAKNKSIYHPEYLTQLDEFEKWFLSQDKVMNVKSLSNLMQDLNQVMHGDEPSWYRIPDSAELAAQYLLFYEFGLPEGLGLNNLVTIHKDASRFSVSVSDAGSDELLAIDQKAQVWLKTNAPAIQVSEATGLGMVFAHIAQRNITSLLKGTLIALVGISAVLMVVLKSFKYGLISLIPNVIPAALAYGLWGMTFGYVDISLSIVACSTLGIVVDDTVHFLHKYIRARRGGLTTSDAIRDSFHRVGTALIITSTVLAAGFLILTISPMNTSATIGLLMAVTLIFALVVDFLLLPPLLLYLDRKSEMRMHSGDNKKEISL